MKRRLKFILLGALACFAAAFSLAGCDQNKTVEQIKTEKNLNAQITYYANGGMFNNVPQKTEISLWLDASKKAYPFNIPSDNKEMNASSSHTIDKGSMVVSRENYIFDGWYYPILDDDGNPAFSEATQSIVLDEKVDFSQLVQAGDHLHIVAKWIVKQKVEIHLVTDVAFTATIEEIKDNEHVKDSNDTIKMITKEVADGEIVALRTYGERDSLVRLDVSDHPAKDAEGVTFVGFYSDKECTNLLSGSALQLQPTDSDQNQVVYAKYIEGSWSIIRNPSDVALLLFEPTGKQANYYLTNNVDMSEYSALSPLREFAGRLQGNGFTISNLKVQSSADSVVNAGKNSIFGVLKEGASFTDVTFENWTYTIDTNPQTVSSLFTYLFWTEISGNVDISGLKIQGGALTVKKAQSAVLGNLPWNEAEEEYEDNHFLFGGEATDAATLGKYAGLTIEGQPAVDIINK